MILILDNYDSFVANIGRHFRNLGVETRIVRNDTVDVAAVEGLAPEALVISPGPGAPHEAGASMDLIAAFSGRLPILGVCLGHQAIGAVFGGRVTRARRPMHGRASAIAHDGSGLFAGIASPTTIARYHSLVVEIDDEAVSPLAVTARCDIGEIMGLAHREHPTFGVQFHPESVLTEAGTRLFANFLAEARRFRTAGSRAA